MIMRKKGVERAQQKQQRAKKTASQTLNDDN
jgi:hypothetical protein